MIKEDCLYYKKYKDMGATVDWCQNYPHLNFDCEKCARYIEKNFVQVVYCKDCVHNQLPPTSGNAECELWYGMTDVYGYCHYSKRRERDDADA